MTDVVLQDLNNYMRGVSTPSYQFSILASEYLRARGDPNQVALMGEFAACCRAYTRIVLRLRAQAEAEARNPSSAPVAASQAPSSPPSRRAPSLQRGTSRGSSRAPSVSPSYTATISLPVRAAQSPLFRLRRAPLLQVFVPSPEGDWLSDESVVTCEEELKKAGVSHLMRAGDVVWDVAVGDEGNIGRLVWDGAYLIVSEVSSLHGLEIDTFFDVGFGLHVVAYWGPPEVPAYARLPALVLPSRHPHAGKREPDLPYRHRAVG